MNVGAIYGHVTASSSYTKISGDAGTGRKGGAGADVQGMPLCSGRQVQRLNDGCMA